MDFFIFSTGTVLEYSLQLLWKIIHSTLNKVPYNYHTMDFQFLSSGGEGFAGSLAIHIGNYPFPNRHRKAMVDFYGGIVR